MLIIYERLLGRTEQLNTFLIGVELSSWTENQHASNFSSRPINAFH